MEVYVIWRHFDLEAILDAARRGILAAPTTWDSRSHYGQPIFRCERLPEVGEKIILVYSAEEEAEEEVRVIWRDEESKWLLTYNPVSGGAEVLAVQADRGKYTRLGNSEISDFENEELETLAEALGCSSCEEAEQIEAVVAAVEAGELWAKGAIHLSAPLGQILL